MVRVVQGILKECERVCKTEVVVCRCRRRVPTQGVEVLFVPRDTPLLPVVL